MGGNILSLLDGDGEACAVCGVDLHAPENTKIPVYPSFGEVKEIPDVIIDFSSPAALPALLELGAVRHIPLVLATTGYSPKQLATIDDTARKVPIFRSGNMSLGINVLTELVSKAAAALGSDFDVEIIERHHRRKVDAPSGTALMLAQAASEALPYEPEYIYQRQSVRKPRDFKEIGISSVRGGNIVGDHEVIFAGRDEVIELKHSAMSREVFASGALRAARFLAGVKTPGLYSMKDLVDQII